MKKIEYQRQRDSGGKGKRKDEREGIRIYRKTGQREKHGERRGRIGTQRTRDKDGLGMTKGMRWRIRMRAGKRSNREKKLR